MPIMVSKGPAISQHLFGLLNGPFDGAGAIFSLGNVLILYEAMKEKYVSRVLGQHARY